MESTNRQTDYSIRVITREELIRLLAEGNIGRGRKPARRSWAGAQTKSAFLR
jgi:hypothetical protein